ncbi:MAG: hypothetical protein AAFY55_07020 [Bacteroidota bacterium]
MPTNHLPVTLGSLRRQPAYTAINTLGLATYWGWRSVERADDPV